MYTALSVFFYYAVALSNPGRLIGSQEEVEMKSRAYDPQHYKVDDSADHEDLHKYESQPQQEAQPKQERKANYLTRGFYLSRHERPRTPT